MAIFEAIIKFFSSLLGSSQFADASHALFSDMGASNDIEVYDRAIATARTLIDDGWQLHAVASRVESVHDLTPAHAMAVAASASAPAVASK